MTKPGYGMLGFGMCEVIDVKPPTAKQRILEALEAGPSTSRDLANKLKLPLGTVPATMSQLKDAGKVRGCGISTYGKTRVQSTIWEKI